MSARSNLGECVLSVVVFLGLGGCGTATPTPGMAGMTAPGASLAAAGDMLPLPQRFTSFLDPRTKAFAQRGNGWLSPAARRTKKLVYVGSIDGSYGAVYLFTPALEAPVGEITDGVNTPNGIATDSAGNLYVANEEANTVTVYPPGKLDPSEAYTQGVNFPTGVAVGSDGTTYISNAFGGPSDLGVVTEYAKGSMSPSKTISLAGWYAMGVALDAANNLYVSWWSASASGVQIYEYAPGSTSGKSLGFELPTGLFPAYTIAFDHSGNIVISVEPLAHTEPKYLAVFPPGATKPARKINLSSLLDTVIGFAFPKNPKQLYIGSANDNDILLLTYPAFKIRAGEVVGGASGVALSPGV